MRMSEKVENLIAQGDQLSRQLEDKDPSESLRIQAEVEKLKVNHKTLAKIKYKCFFNKVFILQSVLNIIGSRFYNSYVLE